MTKAERKNWIINIENCAEAVASKLGDEAVVSILHRYGASSVYKLSPSDYSEVFSELYAIEADLK